MTGITKASLAKKASGTPAPTGGAAEPSADSITFDFNPESLQLTFSNQSGGTEAANADRSTTARSNTTRLDATLYFDNTEIGSDVRAGGSGTDKLKLFARPTDGTPVPELTFSWGTFTFDGIIESLTETLDFWSVEGVPLRSTVQLTMTGRDLDKITPRSELLRTVDAPVGGWGVTAIATQGGDSSQQRKVSRDNRIENPRFPGGTGGGGLSPEFGAAASASASAGGGGAGMGASASASASASVGAGAGAGGGISLGLDAGAGIGAAAGFKLGFSAGASVGFGFGASASLGAGASIGAGAGLGIGAGISAGMGGGIGLGAGASFGAGLTSGFDAGAGFSAGAGFAAGGESWSTGASAGVSAGVWADGSGSGSFSTSWEGGSSGGTSWNSVSTTGTPPPAGMRGLAGLSASQGAFAGLSSPAPQMPGRLNTAAFSSGPAVMPGVDAEFDVLGRMVGAGASASSPSVTRSVSAARAVRIF